MKTLTEEAAAALLDSEADATRQARIAELVAESEARAAAEAAEAQKLAQRAADVKALDRARVERQKIDAEGDVILEALAAWVERSEQAAASHVAAGRLVEVSPMPWSRRELLALQAALTLMSRDMARDLGKPLRLVRLSDPL